jgi:chromosome segregation ATPase
LDTSTNSLRQQVADQPTQALRERSQSITKQLQSLDNERNELHGKQRQLQQQRQARERELLFQHDGRLPASDKQLDELRAAEQELAQRLREVPFRIEQLREVSLAVHEELTQRQERLTRLAEQAVKEAWQPKYAERIEVARRAVVDAMLAHAAEHGSAGNPLKSVEASAFFDVVMHPIRINGMLQQKYQDCFDAVKAKLIKNNDKL